MLAVLPMLLLRLTLFCSGGGDDAWPRVAAGRRLALLSPSLPWPAAAEAGGGGQRGVLVLPSVMWWQAGPSPPLPPAAAGGQGPACGGARPFPLAAACGACGKRRCAALGPAADDGRPTFACSSWCGGGPTLASSPLWCAGGPASPPSLNGLARRRRRVLCSLPLPAAARSQSRGSLGRARPLGRRPAGGWQRATPPHFDGRRQGPFLRPLPWPFVAGSTVEILRDDVAQ